MLLQLRMASQAADRLFQTASGATRPQFHILCAIERATRGSTTAVVCQRDLMRDSGIDRSTIADIVRRLLSRGYITRTRAKDDARRDKIRLTAEGRAELARLMLHANKLSQSLHDHAGRGDAIEIVPALERIATIDAVEQRAGM